MQDAAAVLFYPWLQERLPAPSTSMQVMFLNAQPCADLAKFQTNLWFGIQGKKHLLDQMIHAGMGMKIAAEFNVHQPPTPLDYVCFLPERVRVRTRAQMASALLCLKPDGYLLVAQSNNEGARSTEGDLAQLCASVASESKQKCRIFWAQAKNLNRPLAAQWIAGDQPVQLTNGFWSRPGLFAWDRTDPASALLASVFTNHIVQGRALDCADLGCGYGYLAKQLLQTSSQIQTMHCYETDWHALQLCERNLAMPHSAQCQYFWHDVTSGLLGKYDLIVSNPPFHQGRADQPGLGQAFIRAAAQSLKPGGQLLLVANQHLPYEALLGQLFASHKRIAQANGFKVLQASL